LGRGQVPLPAIAGTALIPLRGEEEALYLMFKRLRSTWLAGGGAVLLALSLSGVVAAAALVTAITTPQVDEAPPADADTTLTFEDLDADGIDDDCDDEVVADEAAALAAEEAADLDGDGVISTSEAAQSGRIGGTNCNHGGYVSTVAHDDCDEDADAQLVVAACEEPAEEPVEDTEDPVEEPVVCEAAPVVEEPVIEEPVDTASNAHGKAVSDVAHDKDAVGGKNCNHGGAVSEAAKKDQAAKDAAKAARDEARADAKADKAKNSADKAKSHGKKNGG
jgi:hypothetical protein